MNRIQQSDEQWKHSLQQNEIKQQKQQQMQEQLQQRIQEHQQKNDYKTINLVDVDITPLFSIVKFCKQLQGLFFSTV